MLWFVDVNSKAREARSRQKNPLFSVCCGEQQCNCSMLCLGSGTGWPGVGISGNFIPFGSSFWLSLGLHSCLQPFLAVKPPCSEPAVLFFSQSLGMVWDWPKLALVLGNVSGLKRSKNSAGVLFPHSKFGH